MDLLFVCGEAPTAAHPRPHGLLRALARRGHSVTVLFADEAGTTFDDLGDQGRHLMPVRRRRLAETFAMEAQPGRYDLVHIDMGAAPLLARVTTGLPSVLDAVICASMRRERALRSQSPLARAAQSPWLTQQRREEAALLKRFSRVIMAAEADAAALRILAGDVEGQGSIHLVPSPLDTERLRPPQRLRDQATVLVDLRELTRHEAGLALAHTTAVMTALWETRGDARLTVLGAVPFGTAGRLAGDPRVVFTGAVNDPYGHLATATLVLVPVEPLLALPHSALEAMATGAALVARPALAGDLGPPARDTLLAADTPAAQAGLILALLDDPPLRGRLGRAGRKLVELEHSWERALGALENVYAAATGSAIAEWRLELGMDRPRLGE